VASALGLSGCSANFGTTSDTATQTAVHIQGLVHGGQQPISGAHVYMYAASTAAYGGNGIAPTAGATGNASTSLLTAATGNPADTNGNFYVTTDTGGNFNINGAFACTSGQQVYLYSTGGDPQLNGVGVAGTPNPAATLLAVVGDCSGSAFPGVTSISMNEVTTVAAAYALAGFATDPLHIGAPSAVTGHSLAGTGFANAFNTAVNIVSQTTGVPNATLPLNASASVPVNTINTVADILAACINSNGAGSSGCSTLFTNTTYGTAPADTATAAINMAQHPGASVSNLLALATNASPFQPFLTSANDLSLGITYTGGGLQNQKGIAIDDVGNAWVANSAGNSVIEISRAGAFLSGTSGYTGGGLSEPLEIAIDSSGDAWVTNSFSDTVSTFSSTGAVLSGPGFVVASSDQQPWAIAFDAAGHAWVSDLSFDTGTLTEISNFGIVLNTYTTPTSGGLGQANGVAIDGAGSAWVTDAVGPVAEFSNAGALLSGPGYPDANQPDDIAIDGAGDVWVSNFNNTVTEFSNAGTVLHFYVGGGLSAPEGVAIDGSGNAWVANSQGNSVSEIPNSGAALNNYTSSGLSRPEAIAADGSGNVWVSNLLNSSITEIIGIGTPVITPIAAGLPVIPTKDGSSNLGTRP
jgi:streptogramin lyase